MTTLRVFLLTLVMLLPAFSVRVVQGRETAHVKAYAEGQQTGVQNPSAPSPAGPSQNESSRGKAQALVSYGKYQLHLGQLDEAETECEAALKLDPASKTAQECLDLSASMKIDAQLNQADNLVLNGQRSKAAAIAASLVNSGGTPAQQERARRILRRAQAVTASGVWQAIPDWIRQIIVAVLFILVAAIVIHESRRVWWATRRGKRFRRKTTWSLLPLRELPGTNDGEKATDGLLDAISRLGDELDRSLWEPRLLLLRPTPPADYEPAVISDFLSDVSMPVVALTPAMRDLRLEWNFHEVRLDEAAQNLQLKAGGGIDFGSLVRFLMTVWKWITAGTPTISGSVEKSENGSNGGNGAKSGADSGNGGQVAAGSDGRSISIHLAARGIEVRTVSITTSIDVQAGIDCVQLAAERAAFKFLIRMKYPQMTNDEVNGIAALRQGASLFGEFAGTNPGGGSAAATRTSSLSSAAGNLEFFRSSIPVHCELSNVTQTAGRTGRAALAAGKRKNGSGRSIAKAGQEGGIKITDEIRQGALLAEGVADALSGQYSALSAAISCFRQLQEWPGSLETLSFRQQAAYNEAVVHREMGYYGKCVLMLTELLGDPIPDAVGDQPEPERKTQVMADLPESIALAARLARLAAFAQYNRDDWTTLPIPRAKLLIDDAERLVTDLAEICEREHISVHDCKIARYMHVETLRAIGHVELRRAIQGPAGRFYDPDTNRPTGLLTDELNKNVPDDRETIDRLERSIAWMRECEELAPSSGLFCDIAESNLLLKNFGVAQAYARHATLGTIASTKAPSEVCEKWANDPNNERAFYLAAESFLLGKKECLARKYAQSFPGAAKLDEFKALRAQLGL